MKLSDIKDKLSNGRPGLADYLQATKDKRSLATNLVATRRKANLKPTQVAVFSGLNLAQVLELENPSGAMPSEEAVAKYLQACGSTSI